MTPYEQGYLAGLQKVGMAYPPERLGPPEAYLREELAPGATNEEMQAYYQRYNDLADEYQQENPRPEATLRRILTGNVASDRAAHDEAVARYVAEQDPQYFNDYTLEQLRGEGG
jgi:hypothetical protein